MAGTSGYSYDVSKSMDIKDPLIVDKPMDETAALINNVQKYTIGGPAVTLNRFQRQDARNAYLGAELDRRKAAAEGATQLAGIQDERVAGAANQLAAAMDKYRNTQDDLSQRQAQAVTEADQTARMGITEIDIKKNMFDWELEKNQTKRDDAISDAWVEGMVNNKLQDLQIAGQMRLQDIDQYYKLWQNEIDQSFKDWEQKTKADWEAEIAKVTANAQAMAQIFAGSLTMADAGIEAYFRRKGTT